MIDCAVIDDEPLARDGIIDYINKIDFLRLVGKGNSALELSSLMEKKKIDLVFMDIQMPVINGIDYIKMTSNLPMVILTTAYPSYALEGYDLDVIDYLLKPITFNRFLKAALKAKEYHFLKTETTEAFDTKVPLKKDYCFIKCEGKYEKICFDDILFIKAIQNYVAIITPQRKYMTLINLKTVAEQLDPNMFIQVHKSFMVSIANISTFETHEIRIGDHKIPIGRTYRKGLVEKIIGNRLWKKN